MARSKSATLTEAELRIMNVLWDRGSSTVHEVLQRLPAEPALAYNSVLTIIRILEKKGYVSTRRISALMCTAPGRPEGCLPASRFAIWLAASLAIPMNCWC